MSQKGQSLKNLLLITAIFLSSARPLAKGRLKMHFLQVECKSSSRSGADPDLHLRGGQIMYWGLGAGAPEGSRGKAPGQGSEGRSPSEADDIFLFQRLIS